MYFGFSSCRSLESFPHHGNAKLLKNKVVKAFFDPYFCLGKIWENFGMKVGKKGAEKAENPCKNNDSQRGWERVGKLEMNFGLSLFLTLQDGEE